MSATPVSGVNSLQVAFPGSASGGLAPYSFSWSYDDGANGSGGTATHSYAPGTFHPTLTVQDAAGGTWTGPAGTIPGARPPAAPPAPQTAPPGPTGTSPPPSSSPSGQPSGLPPVPPPQLDH